jgi:hypothetical protein
MKTIYLIKTGKKITVANNEAHRLIDAGIASLKEIEFPKKDKMIRKKKIRTKII